MDVYNIVYIFHWLYSFLAISLRQIYLFLDISFLDFNISFSDITDVDISSWYRLYHAQNIHNWIYFFLDIFAKDISKLNIYGYMWKNDGYIQKKIFWIYQKNNISIRYIVDISSNDISNRYIRGYNATIVISSNISRIYPIYLIISMHFSSEKIQKLSFFWVFLVIFF